MLGSDRVRVVRFWKQASVSWGVVATYSTLDSLTAWVGAAIRRITGGRSRRSSQATGEVEKKKQRVVWEHVWNVARSVDALCGWCGRCGGRLGSAGEGGWFVAQKMRAVKNEWDGYRAGNGWGNRVFGVVAWLGVG